MPIQVAYGAASHPGRKRPVNEDSYLAEGPLFLVADGMGGHSAGEVASALVVGEFARLVGRDRLCLNDLRTALTRAQARVDELRSGLSPAGTTLTGVAISDINGVGCWIAINIGDSRTYRLSGDVLEQISVDHSLIQELIDEGDFAEAALQKRNIITRAIGAGSGGDADFWMIPAAVGDRILICSDGLSNELSDDRLAVLLRTERNPQRAASQLVREALSDGGTDDITVLVVDALRVSSIGHNDDDESGETSPRASTESRTG